MTALDDRGLIIADWWRANPGRHTWAATLLGVRMNDSARSRSARKRAQAIAMERGDCVQYAVWRNAYTWQYVSSGESVESLVDPMLHASLTAAGVKAKERKIQDHMVKERMRGLSAQDRELVQIQIDLETNQRQAAEINARMVSSLVRLRNQNRNGEVRV